MIDDRYLDAFRDPKAWHEEVTADGTSYFVWTPPDADAPLPVVLIEEIAQRAADAAEDDAPSGVAS